MVYSDFIVVFRNKTCPSVFKVEFFTLYTERYDLFQKRHCEVIINYCSILPYGNLKNERI